MKLSGFLAIFLFCLLSVTYFVFKEDSGSQEGMPLDEEDTAVFMQFKEEEGKFLTLSGLKALRGFDYVNESIKLIRDCEVINVVPLGDIEGDLGISETPSIVDVSLQCKKPFELAAVLDTHNILYTHLHLSEEGSVKFRAIVRRLGSD